MNKIKEKLKENKKMVISVLGVFGILFLTISITYAWFSYAKQGVKENVIKSGAITFHYEEGNRQISIDDAMPMTDQQGKLQTDYFDFDITANTSSTIDIPYYITARRTADSSTNMDNVIKIYLTKVDGSGNEQEVLLTKYSELNQYTNSNIDLSRYVEKLVHQDKVVAGTRNYMQKYRLRIWIDKDAEFITQNNGIDAYQYQDKHFTLMINVYGNGNEVRSSELASRNNTNISTIVVGGKNATTEDNINYDVTLPSGTTETEIVVDTENTNANVTVQRVTTTGVIIKDEGIKRLSVTKMVPLEEGENNFKITVTTENNTKKQYNLLVTVGGTNSLAAGLYDKNGNMIYTWQQLIDNNYLKFTSATSTLSAGTDVDGLHALAGDLVIDDSVIKIYNSTFKDCINLTSVYIPNSVNYIDSYSFKACTGLKKINIEKETALGYIDSLAFTQSDNIYNEYENGLYLGNDKNPYMYLAKIKDKTVSSINIHSNTKVLGNGTCQGCGALTSVVIPDGVETLGSYAFSKCTNLTNISIPNSVKKIGQYAFRGTGITNIPTMNGVETMGAYVFSECPNLENITIPSNVAAVLGNSSFYKCDNLTHIAFENGTKSISKSSIGNVTSLTDVVIPNSVATIEKNAFSGCSNLSYITIPNSVTTIEDGAFTRSGLISVEIPNSITAISKELFASCKKLENVVIPNSVTTIGESAFKACTNLTTINIPNSVTEIGKRAFEQSSGLTSIRIPSSVTSIGNYAFISCSNLGSVTFDDKENWSAGDKSFTKEELENTSNVATFIKNTYTSSKWIKSN